MSQHSTWDWSSLFVLIGVMSVVGALSTIVTHCNATKPARIQACREACAPETVREYSDGEGCVCD